MEFLDHELSAFPSQDDYLHNLSQSSLPLAPNSSQSSTTPKKVKEKRNRQSNTSFDIDGGRGRSRFGEAKKNEKAFGPLGRKARYSRTIIGSQGEILPNDMQPYSSQQLLSSPTHPTMKSTKRTRGRSPSNSLNLVVLGSADSNGSDDDGDRGRDVPSPPKIARLGEKNGNVLRRTGKGKERARDQEDDEIEDGDGDGRKRSKIVIKKKKKGITDREMDNETGKDKEKETRRTRPLLVNPTLHSSPIKHLSTHQDLPTATRPKPRKKRPPPIPIPSSSNLNTPIDLITPSSGAQSKNTFVPETPPTLSTSQVHSRSRPRSRSRSHDDGLSASPISPFKEDSFSLSQRKVKHSRNSIRDDFMDSPENEEGEWYREWEKSSPSRPAPFPMTIPRPKAKKQGIHPLNPDVLDEMEAEGSQGVSASGRLDKLSLEVDELGSDSGSDDELLLKPSRRQVDDDFEPAEDGHPKLLLTGGRAEVFCSKFISTTEKCPYCSELLPKRQSTELVQRFARLAAVAPSTGELSIHWTRTIGACKLHRAETHIIPLGEMAGYPRTLDAGDLRRRVKSKEIMKDVEQVLHHPSRSAWFHFAKRDIEDAGGRRKWLSCGMVQSAAVLERLQPGYYGEIGRRVITTVLTSALNYRLSDVIDSTLFEPLEKDDLIHHVLIPEVAVSLTRQDLGPRGKGREGRDLAIRIVKESREYGQARFGEVEAMPTPLLASSTKGNPQQVHVLSDDSDAEPPTRPRPIIQNDDDEDDFDRSLGSLAPEQLVQAVEAFDSPRPAAQAAKAKPVLASWVDQQGTRKTKQEPPSAAPRPDRRAAPVRPAWNKTTLGMRTAYAAK